MKKKNHTLRHWTIWTITWTVVTWVLILLGTVLSGSLNEGGNVVPKAVNWFNEFGTYVDVFGALKEGMLWDFSHLYADIVWYVGITLTGLAFFITFIIACAKKKAKYIFASILNLVLCGGILYAYLGLYYSNYLNPAYIQPGLLAKQFTQLLLFKAEGVNFGWSIYAYCLVIAILFSLIGVIGIFFVTLVRLFKKEEIAVATETVTTKQVEKITETPIVQPEPKKKGVLILKRYDKYGKSGPIFESQDTSYPNQTIVQKSLTADEVRTVVRDEFERQEALKLADQYKQEKNAQLIAEAIVKATNSNKSADEKLKVEETCASSFEQEEEKKIYPSPIVFAMPASAGEEFKQKPAKKPEPPKSEPKAKLNTERIHEIIAEELSKALSEFVITKETVIQKPVEIKIPVKEEKIEEVSETPVIEETTPVEETKAVETEVTPEVIDETVAPDTVVEETVVEELPEEKAEETTPEVETVEETKEETPTPEVEEKKEYPADIPLTSNGTPKIIRIPFTVRMESADQGLRDAYNELKSLLKSYGLNNRVSNSGDTFRLHRVTYCKITIAGKSLKLYLALNPADYVDTTYPIKDASSKAIYKETPLVFKVKSGLSLRRGEELIRDCMDKHGLEQVKQLETRDWATDLNSVEFENDDFDDGEDEE